MSQSRESAAAGAPIEEHTPSEAEVQAALDRAQNEQIDDRVIDERAAEERRLNEHLESGDDTLPAKADGPGIGERAAEAEHAEGVAAVVAGGHTPAESTAPSGESLGGVDSERTHREKVAAIATAAYDPIADDEAARYAAAKSRIEAGQESDDVIRVEKDHPMAALYLQAPTPPDMRGNRVAGVFISLLATLVFGLLYAGVLALGLARQHTQETFLSEGLLPFLTSAGFIAAVVGFFLAMVVLVLLVGRAGWWAYVLGGFWVAVAVLAAATVGYGFSPQVTGLNVSTDIMAWDIATLKALLGFLPILAAALVAREVSMWFGAWIGARGRRMTAANKDALAEYERAVEDAKASS